MLHGISLTIHPGETVALVGSSGGGKTTLARLIPRFYDVTSGEIRIDGVNIKDIQLESLRSNIGVVQQDVFLFSGSIRENILYGNPNASEEEMIAAAKQANIHDFVESLPDKYESYVGEHGLKLSGGQKQRISIARVFLKNPPILILDEATSALDNVTEKQIQAALDKLAQGRTTIVIAHRLSTIRHADRIGFGRRRHTRDGIARRAVGGERHLRQVVLIANGTGIRTAEERSSDPFCLSARSYHTWTLRITLTCLIECRYT